MSFIILSMQMIKLRDNWVNFLLPGSFDEFDLTMIV
jgi:hypothetical protein